MTGTVEYVSFSEKLIRDGNMKLLRYPVHQNHREFMQLVKKNNFQLAVPYHSVEIQSDNFLEL